MTSRKSKSSSHDAHALVLTLPYPDERTARRIAASLRPEVGDIAGDRTSVSLERDGDELRIDVAANDLVSLRAGINTWTTLVEVAEELVGTAPE